MPRQGIQLAYPYSAGRIKKWQRNADLSFVFVQAKLNGERLKWDGCELLTSEGNQCVSVPHIVDELIRLFPNYPLDGEGYKHGWSKAQIRSVLGRRVNLHEQHEQIKFYVFDRPTQDEQHRRIVQLLQNRRFEKCEHIIRVPTYRATSTDQIQQFVTEQVQDGYEGAIIRHPLAQYVEKRTPYMLKWKPGGRDDYKIVEMIEGTGKYEGTLGALVVVGSNGQKFHVGSFKLTDAERNDLWARRKELEGKSWAQIRYTELTDRGVPPSGVFECLIRK